MIGYLSGKIIYKRPDSLVVEAGGVGYKVFVSKDSSLESSIGEKKELFCYHLVREDASDLFGFDSPSDLEIFEKLLLVSGVGPRVAMAIVSALGKDKIISAIAQNNPSLFKGVSGVGGKLAAKIVIELRSKLNGGETVMPEDDETVDALVALGYKKSEIIPLLSELPIGLASSSDKIRHILKMISKK